MSGRKRNSVLIVDDERASISALKNILYQDYTIYASNNGQDAIETAGEFLPDIILLDVLMPDMDGYDVITALKKSANTCDIPVIIITGLGNIDDEEKGLALGAADYITKPFHPAIVKLRVQNHLKLAERLRQQALMTKISRNFLTDTYTESLYTDTLSMVGDFMNLAAVLLYKYDEDNNFFICQNEWINPDLNLKSRIGGKILLNENSNSAINYLLSADNKNFYLRSNDPLLIDNIALNYDNSGNFITTPVFIKGKLSAILVFSAEEVEWNWSSSDIDLAVHVTSIFSGVFERDAMERQYSIVENSPNIVLYISSDADIEYVNPAALNVAGYTKLELISQGLGAIFSSSTLNDIKEKYIPASMRGESVLFETELIRKNGAKRILMISVIQAGKNSFGFITRDLTEIRELEAGLIASKEQAEYLSRAKSEFLSRMSHEMRTPMNAIMGLLQIADLQGVPDNLKDNFKKMSGAAHSLLHLIDDVLDFSDMEYDVFKLSESIFYFNDMIRDVLLAADDKASNKRQLINCSIDPEIPVSLYGDEKRLKQVIKNFLGNAVKFSPEDGDISFNARVVNADNETVTVRFEVTDNGIGISKEQYEKLFSVFEQGNGSLSREHGGIGIGLALSKRIVETMGGDIHVESELGKGAKFYFNCKFKKVK